MNDTIADHLTYRIKRKLIMIIHLSPSIYACPKTEPCSLIDLTCNELNIDLVGGKELTARRPYPNKK
ncbi:hypothetical protein ALP90_200101 [Pseudomonas amygdali pv. ulmi]|uniref:Uncharacterized protein n=1 Tax=Pseudomonas amygdali pv. ulmi TaxID=251720 RepID=A0A3M4SPL0_PSEA0|nr:MULTISPECIES: DUF6012 family protein [Pseudomonas syringae group genomosp. 2]RMR16853.1 hypothetical protein ALP90_200101 [Pseudomonas amygdali pv. ulmi]RMU52057.1 hypothetical protein ALP27_01209 [Pseudomonas savastanoi pv. glycinea]